MDLKQYPGVCCGRPLAVCASSGYWGGAAALLRPVFAWSQAPNLYGKYGALRVYPPINRLNPAQGPTREGSSASTTGPGRTAAIVSSPLVLSPVEKQLGLGEKSLQTFARKGHRIPRR